MSEGRPVRLSLKAAALEAVRNGDLDTAIAKYREYLDLPPNHMDDDAWCGLGGAYRRKQEMAQALSSYERAYAINPQSTYALSNIVSLLAASNLPVDRKKLRQYLPEAMRLAQERSAASEADHWTWYDLATTQLIDGIFDKTSAEEALKTFYYAAERTPKTAKEHFRSVLNNLTFLAMHNPAIPQIDTVIRMIKQHTDE